MPTERFAFSVAAGAVVANAIAGSQFEFLATVSRVQLYVTQDPADLGEVEVFFGQEIQLPNSVIGEAAAAVRGPIIPDDLVVDDVGAPGDRLVIRLTNPSGAAAVIRGLLKIDPVAM